MCKKNNLFCYHRLKVLEETEKSRTVFILLNISSTYHTVTAQKVSQSLSSTEKRRLLFEKNLWFVLKNACFCFGWEKICETILSSNSRRCTIQITFIYIPGYCDILKTEKKWGSFYWQSLCNIRVYQKHAKNLVQAMLVLKSPVFQQAQWRTQYCSTTCFSVKKFFC